MFKNHEFRVRLVKNKPQLNSTENDFPAIETQMITPEDISSLALSVGVTVVKVYASIKLVKTTCNLLEIAARGLLK
jgi:hypothetical protein